MINVKLNHIVTGLFVLLLAGAVYFRLEKMLFADASFILFKIINLESLQIQEHRYGSFITQIFPLAAVMLQLPLSIVIWVYAVSFNLFYLVVVFLLAYRCRETSLALLMSFYFVLFVSDAYFWTNNEVHQGIAWMFLFFGLLHMLDKKPGPGWMIFPVFTLLAFLALFTHPLVIFPFAFLWIFLLLQKQWSFTKNQLIVMSIILVIIAVGKYWLSTGGSSHYDAEKLHRATHISLQNITEAFTSSMATTILKKLITEYWLVPVLFLAGTATAFQLKKYKELILVYGFSVFYILAVCITFDEFIPFYTESQLMPLSIITTTLFVFYTLLQLKPKAAIWFVVIIFTIRLFYINAASNKWIERKQWLTSTLQKMQQMSVNKGLVEETESNMKTAVMSWGIPIESILASALIGDKPQRTFVLDKPANLQSRRPANTNQMIASFELLYAGSLNTRYFNFDTTTQYQSIK